MLVWMNLIILVGMICLQIFLSKRVSRIPGLILPMITLVCSVLEAIGVVMNTFVPDGGSGTTVIVMAVMTFIGCNIPTILLLAIYFVCREKDKRKKQLEKMNIQDLD